MKYKYLTVAILFASNLASSASATIPTQFHGFWATPTNCKLMNQESIDRPSVEITKSQFNFGLIMHCKLGSPTKSDTQSFSGKFNCLQEGDKSKKTMTVNLVSPSILTIKGEDYLAGMSLSVCKLKNRN